MSAIELRTIAKNFFLLRIFNDLVDFTPDDPHSAFRRFAPRVSPSCFHSASTGGAADAWKKIEHRNGTAPHAEVDQTRDRRRRSSGGRTLHLGRRPARLRAARAPERAQGVHRSVPRRATFAPDELGAKHRTHLRAGTHPGNHHHRRRQERRRPRRETGRRPADHHRQGAGRPLRQGARHAPCEREHGQGLQADAGACDCPGTRAPPRDRSDAG